MEYNPEFEDFFDYVGRTRSLPSRESANIIQQLVNVVYYLTLQIVDSIIPFLVYSLSNDTSSVTVC